MMAWALQTGVLMAQPFEPPASRFAGVNLSDNGRLAFAGTAGVTNGTYYVLVSTNLNTPPPQWSRLVTNHFNVAGNFNFTNALDPAWPQAFYRLELQ